jgi:hypothetical protein
MRAFILKLRKRWLERHLTNPFNREISLQLDKIQQELDTQPASARHRRKKQSPRLSVVPVESHHDEQATHERIHINCTKDT